jgi:uncharacterized membrane protein YqjE
MQDLLADLAATLASRIRLSARRQMGTAFLFGLALLFVGLAIVAAIAAIGVALAARWGVLSACLIIAAVALVLAVGLVVVVTQQEKEAQRRRKAELEKWRQTILAAKAIAPDLAAGKALLIATALGLIVGLTAGKKEPQDKT